MNIFGSDDVLSFLLICGFADEDLSELRTSVSHPNEVLRMSEMELRAIGLRRVGPRKTFLRNRAEWIRTATARSKERTEQHRYECLRAQSVTPSLLWGNNSNSYHNNSHNNNVTRNAPHTPLTSTHSFSTSTFQKPSSRLEEALNATHEIVREACTTPVDYLLSVESAERFNSMMHKRSTSTTAASSYTTNSNNNKIINNNNNNNN
eukprot:PhM_4_TR10163/c1_g1_i1/m.55514